MRTSWTTKASTPIGTPDGVVQWFKLHRHYNAEVLLMTQSFRDINQPIAQLIAMLIKCRKADILGNRNEYIRKVHQVAYKAHCIAHLSWEGGGSRLEELAQLLCEIFPNVAI